MASLVIQAAVSYAVSWAISQLTPTQNVQGPRLSNLKVQTSTYGNSIPRVYGAARMAGNMIWSLPILETSHKQTSGGKGGGGPGVTQETYTYSQTFAVAVCDGPIVGIRKIWANGELIYNVDSAASVSVVGAAGQWSSLALYNGSETQTADPTIQTYVGAANTPAYRGTAYVVFDGMQLEKYGNRPPNLEFEVVAHGSVSSPVVVRNVTSVAIPGIGDLAYVYSGIAKNGTVTFVSCQTTITSVSRYTATFDLDMNFLSHTPPQSSYPYSLPTNGSFVQNNPRWYYSGGGLSGYQFTSSAAAWTDVDTYFGFGATYSGHSFYWPAEFLTVGYSYPGAASMYAGGYIWIATDMYNVANNYLARYGFTDGVPNSNADFARPLPGDNTTPARYEPLLYDDIIGRRLYVQMYAQGAGITDHLLFRYDYDGNRLNTWTFPKATYPNFPGVFAVSDGRYCSVGGVYGVTGYQAHPGFVADIHDDDTFTVVTASATPPTYGLPSVTGLRGVALSITATVVYGGVVTATPQNVSDVLAAEVALVAPLTAGDIDATSVTDTIDGYVVAQRQSVRASIEPLGQMFYFDAVESDNKIKFVKRGGAVSVVIPEDDLAAHGYGSQMPDQIVTTRKQEVDLPLEVSVGYMASGSGYQQGAQYSRRLTTNSVRVDSLTYAASLSDAKAKNVADVMLYSAWAAREVFKFVTSREYSYLDPTDIVQTSKGPITYTMRLTSKDEQNGMETWEAEAEDVSVYTQSSSSSATPPSPVTITQFGPTDLLLMDIPLLRDADDGYGFYAAACGLLSGWSGAALYKSTDNEASWYAFGDGLFNPSAIGQASTALGSFAANIFDETNSVTVVLAYGTMSSTTEVNVLNGANAVLIGDEVLQFKTATLVATNTYTLTGLLRGRRGTEWAVGTHAIGDRVALLSSTTTYRLSDGSSELGLTRQYKGVSFGTALSDATSQDFADTGVCLKPYSPVHVGGGRNAAGDLTLTWQRRTRVGGAWNDYVDASLGETSESYEVDVMSGSTVKRTITGISSPTTSYTAAQQTTDFGSPQSSVTVNVYQISSTVGRGYAGNGVV